MYKPLTIPLKKKKLKTDQYIYYEAVKTTGLYKCLLTQMLLVIAVVCRKVSTVLQKSAM